MNESIIKETIMYDKYYIHWSYKSNKIICDCHNGIIAEKVNISKEKIYNSIKKLGSDIYTLLKKDLLFSKELEIEIDENIFESDTNLFDNIDLLILNSYEVKTVIYQWLKENGIPSFNVNSIINLEFSYKEKGNIFYAENSNSMSNASKNIIYLTSLDKYELNIIPLISVAILIYLISYIKDIISTARPSFLKKALPIFPCLYKKYEEANFVYTKEISRNIITYMQKIIICMQYYIKNNFYTTDYSEIKITDNIELPKSKKDIPWVDFNFITQQYHSVNMFFTAFNYMINLFSNNNRLEKIYYCKECNTQLLKKQNLCLNCKIRFGESLILNKYKEDTKEKIKDEMKDLTEKNIDTAPTLEKIYYDRWIHNQKYYKKKKGTIA